jgi:hypothetical protein
MIQACFARRDNPTASPWLLATLVVCCLVTRAAMARKLDAICNDAVFYVDLANHYEKGDPAGGLGRLGLNLYPPVLALLHHLGIGWENAGKWWGVGVASLAVLPLYGWLRRQFDERTALAAAILYAFHPKLVEWSPELLRDPTFWPLWALALYSSWRAAEELRLRWYAIAGVAITAAAHTRFEGWFLYIPLVAWSLGRLARTRRDGTAGVTRGRIAGGVLLSMAISPLAVVLVNVTLLRGLPRWELGNFERLSYAAQWFEATWSATASATGRSPQVSAPEGRLSLRETTPSRVANDDEPKESLVAPSQPRLHLSAAELTERMPVSRMALLYGNALRRGFGSLFGLAWLVGIVVGRRRLFRADHAILFVVAACVAAAAWIHLWYGQATSSRYFLAIVLLACPCSAIGGLWVYDRLLALPTGLQNARWCRPAATAAVILITAGAGVGESLADRHAGRSREAELGRWLLAEFGPKSRIATVGPMPRIGFYAQTAPTVLSPAEAISMDPAVYERFDTLVAARCGANEPWLEPMVDLMRSRGYQTVESRRLPAGYKWTDLVLLIRDPAAAGDIARDERGQTR